jgi:hypothetical protein
MKLEKLGPVGTYRKLQVFMVGEQDASQSIS